MGHQTVALRRAWPLKEFALFHEMGTGKTFTTINLAAARYLNEQIDALVIICDTPIKSIWYTGRGTWTDEEGKLQGSEIEKWCPVDYSCWVWESGDRMEKWFREKRDELKILIIGVEALSITNGNAYNAIEYFRRFHKFMCVVDESESIKNYKAARTKTVATIGGWADYRLILTGTPITQGLEDLFGQFNFLNAKIIECRNYFVFRNKYCVMGGFKGKKILGYQFQDHLMDKIRPYVDYVTKEECMDLPEQIYPEPILVRPTDEQKRVMKQLKTEFAMEDEGHAITISTILERTLRYQQVIGGTFPFEEADGSYSTKPISGKNPKLEAVMMYITGLRPDAKCVIWARFVPEIKYLMAAIAEVYGERSVVDFYGGTDKDQRIENSNRIQTDSTCRFIVSNQRVGGRGQTWTAITFNLYYSNTFSYSDRYQSESRTHRKGQEEHVTYQDFEMAVPEDRMILRAVRKKRDLALEVEEALK